jgi:hypothetical protein
MEGLVHAHDAGFGARNPATSSHCGSSALVETFHPEGSTLLSITAAAVDAVGGTEDAGAEGAAAAGAPESAGRADADGAIADGG